MFVLSCLSYHCVTQHVQVIQPANQCNRCAFYLLDGHQNQPTMDGGERLYRCNLIFSLTSKKKTEKNGSEDNKEMHLNQLT